MKYKATEKKDDARMLDWYNDLHPNTIQINVNV